MSRRMAPLVLAALTACGYGFAARGRLGGGIEAVAVAPFENRSTEPELGAAFAGALREELAARGILARGSAKASLVGDLTVGVPAPSAPGGVTWRIPLTVEARLVEGERIVAKRTLRRDADYAAGIDALETEGRRAQALRKLAVDCARELVSSLVE
jgi:hypothetical protein